MESGGKDRILFLRNRIENLQRSELAWLDKSYGDRHILSLALELKKSGRKVAVISRDSLMSVICNELGIPHKFLEPYHSKVSPPKGQPSSTSGTTVTVTPSSDKSSVRYQSKDDS